MKISMYLFVISVTVYFLNASNQNFSLVQDMGFHSFRISVDLPGGFFSILRTLLLLLI